MGWLARILRRLTGRDDPAAAVLRPEDFILSLDGGEIQSVRPDGSIERVRLDDLRAVIVAAGGPGSAGPRAWWLLAGAAESGCVFPHGATGEDAVLEQLLALPGFDHVAMDRALAAAARGRFLCWQRAATDAGAATDASAATDAGAATHTPRRASGRPQAADDDAD